MPLSQDYYHNRGLLIQRMKSKDSSKFRVSISRYKYWFKILNQQIFGDKLKDFDKVTFEHHKEAYAWFCNDSNNETHLILNNVYSSEKMFIEILTHELIHLWQHQHKQPLGHGPSFMAWSENLSLKGINLYKAYK